MPFVEQFNITFPPNISIWAASWEHQQSAYAKTKTQISFAVTAKLISAFVFATRIVQLLFYLNPEFHAYLFIIFEHTVYTGFLATIDIGTWKEFTHLNKSTPIIPRITNADEINKWQVVHVYLYLHPTALSWFLLHWLLSFMLLSLITGV